MEPSAIVPGNGGEKYLESTSGTGPSVTQHPNCASVPIADTFISSMTITERRKWWKEGISKALSVMSL